MNFRQLEISNIEHHKLGKEENFFMDVSSALEHLKNYWSIYSLVITAIILPLLKIIFKPINVKSDLAEIRKLIDEKEKIDTYPILLKDGIISQISAFKFLNYKAFKTLMDKNLGYWDVFSINNSLSYNSFCKFEIKNIDEEVKFIPPKNPYQWFMENPKITKWISWILFIILTIILLFIFLLAPKESQNILGIIFMIIGIAIEILLLNFISDLNNAIKVKEILKNINLLQN